MEAVVPFKPIVQGYTVREVFDNWIRLSHSESAKKNYSQNTEEFFQLMFNKKIDEVLKHDIDSINPINVNTNYITVLQDKNSNSTVRYKLGNVMAFMRELRSARFDIDISYLEKALSTKRIKKDTQLIQFMSLNDYNDFKDWLEFERFSGRHAHRGAEYAMLLEFMWSTGSRISAVFNVKWSDIIYDEDTFGQYGYSIYIHDKGDKTNWKPVSDSFYNRLREIMYKGDENGKVFKGLSQGKFPEYMREYFGDKDITPHSIKKGAVSHYYHSTNDIVGAQVFGDHESIITTRRYIETPMNRMQQGSSFMTDTDANINSIEDLTHEQLLEIIGDRKDIMFGVYYEAKARDYI